MRCLLLILGLVSFAAMISATAAMTLVTTQGMTDSESAARLLPRIGRRGFLLFGLGPALLMLFSASGCRSFRAAFDVAGGISACRFYLQPIV